MAKRCGLWWVLGGVVPLLAVGLGTCSVALAAPSEAVVSTARRVATEGLAAYDAGRYEEAAEKLQKAFEAVEMPTRPPMGREPW